VSGAIFSAIENTEFTNGLWYALVTITTVGYGDVVPASDHGRMFGALLILFGVVLFSLVTANILAFLIGSEQRRTEQEILHYVKQVKDRLEEQASDGEKQFRAMHRKIEHRLEVLEKELNANQTKELLDELKDLEIKLLNESSDLKQRIDRLEQQFHKTDQSE